ncbi:AAA family ATPase [Nocardiopsis dassonvillei]
MSNSSDRTGLTSPSRGLTGSPIVFVNGPFGVGKTSVVDLLSQRLTEAIVVDPEKVGHMLWAQLPVGLRQEEFEIEPLWPSMTRLLIDLVWRTYGRTLLVPMTMVRPEVFDLIVGNLRGSGHPIQHFALLADPPTIRARLKGRMRRRGEQPDRWGELSWEGLQIERCLESLHHPRFAHHVHTGDRSADEVADLIISLLRQEQRPT